jgi:hypothetical protein
VLSTPPAFVLSQNQTLQTKTTQPEDQVNSNQKNLKQTSQTGKKQRHTPKREKRVQQQQTKTTKHTIEFSNNTPCFRATSPLYYVARLSSNRLPGSFDLGRSARSGLSVGAAWYEPKLTY